MRASMNVRGRRPEPRLRPVVSATLNDLVREIDRGGRRSRASAEGRVREVVARARLRARALLVLLPLALASTLFRAASPRLLGMEAPTAAEQQELLRSELPLVVEEIDAYLEEHGALVANLDAIDPCYGPEIRFQALTDHHYRLELGRGSETIAYDSEQAEKEGAP